MILQCPECQARFLVADHLIPAEGRTVRCGACKHQWHVMKEDTPATEARVVRRGLAVPWVLSVDCGAFDGWDMGGTPWFR